MDPGRRLGSYRGIAWGRIAQAAHGSSGLPRFIGSEDGAMTPGNRNRTSRFRILSRGGTVRFIFFAHRARDAILTGEKLDMQVFPPDVSLRPAVIGLARGIVFGTLLAAGFAATSVSASPSQRIDVPMSAESFKVPIAPAGSPTSGPQFVE